MKTSKFTESQIFFVIKQSESGVKVDEISRKMCISQATFFNWKKKYAGLGIAELKKMKQLEEENYLLKKLVADLSLDKQMLQDVIKKKLWHPPKDEIFLLGLFLNTGYPYAECVDA